MFSKGYMRKQARIGYANIMYIKALKEKRKMQAKQIAQINKLFYTYQITPSQRLELIDSIKNSK